jgi:hypothetical protein
MEKATQKEKLAAALSVVSNSILNGWTTEAKVDYVRQILPSSYEVKESKQAGSVHCKSATGIEDDEQWSYFMSALKERFTDFSEVFHNTCHNHVDFTVYFRKAV